MTPGDTAEQRSPPALKPPPAERRDEEKPAENGQVLQEVDDLRLELEGSSESLYRGNDPEEAFEE